MRSKTLRIPPKTTYLYKVIQAIREHGPMTIAETIPHIRGLAAESANNAFCTCRATGLLACDQRRYSLTAFTQRYFDECEGVKTEPIPAPEIVPPRDPSVFNKEWSGKYNVSAKANRPDAGEAREISFKTGGTGFAPFRGAVL